MQSNLTDDIIAMIMDRDSDQMSIEDREKIVRALQAAADFFDTTEFGTEVREK